MLEASMPLEDVLLVQKKPVILGGGSGGAAAVMAADNTWPVVLLGMAVIVMLMLSARRKGVRAALSFSLNDFNMWYYFFGKGRQRYEVRVRSFASSVGSNCFVTTSGEFTADLAEEEDEGGDGEAAADRSKADCVIRNCYDAAAKTNCIVGTEMVFIYAHSTSSVFVTSSMVGPGFAAAKFRAGLLMGRVYANSIDERDSVFRESGAQVPQELRDHVWDFSAKRPGREISGEDFIAEKSAVPEWASRLFEPLQLERCEIFLPSRILRKNVTDVVYPYPWDAEMKLRLRPQCTHKFPIGEQESCYSSAVVRGPTHTATLRKNVVKIWENPTRRAVMAVPPPLSEVDSRISSLDVDWEKETAFIGSASGLLSLWDLKTGICVSSVGCDRRGSINALQSSNASTSSDHCGLIMTAGRRQSTEDCGGRICLWDSRILTGPVAAGSTSMNSLPLDEFKFKGFELVARDCHNTISVHDIRMLKSSPVVSTSPTEIMWVRKKTGVQNLRSDEDDWWDVGHSNLVFQGEDDIDSSEDAWVMVEQETVKGSSTAPGILSRCFKAISSALAS